MSAAVLGDRDPMPFGKYQDVPMEDVPAQYLCWLWNNGKKDAHRCPVRAYILENLPALEKEYPDGRWMAPKGGWDA